ncbi:MAG: hypothetical protein ACOZIN_20530 [Myxococcota bacterium]
MTWRRRRFLAVGVWLAALACRCDPLIGGVEVGFRVDGSPIDFGKALQGTQVSRLVTLSSTGRAALTVAVATEGPFTAPAEVVVPGGAEAALEVVFTAGDGPAEGKLLLTANERTLAIDLRGRGVPVPPCIPSAPCREARFELESEACVESVVVDGAACRPDSECLENGLCQSGVCVGSPRSCDDANRCTTDACAEGLGCVHSPVSCPASGNPCQVPVCEPLSGCAQAPAMDGTLCGSVDCTTAHLCIGGACQVLPTPDGFVCAPATPCQGEGKCLAQQCVRPDAGELLPAHAVMLPAAREGRLRPIAHNGNLFWSMCAEPSASDAGCRLTSYTGSGFLRFDVPHADERARQVVNVSADGVLVLASDALEAYAAGNGSLLWSAPFASLRPDAGVEGRSSVEAVARLVDGGYLAAIHWSAKESADGGWVPSRSASVARFDADGGAVELAFLADAGAQPLAAVDELGRLFLYDPTGPLTRVHFDGGEAALQVLADVPGLRSLAAANGALVAGAQHLFDADGGVHGTLAGMDDAGQALFFLPELLLSGPRGYGFYRRCLAPFGPACTQDEKATFLRAFVPTDGGVLWETKILPEGAPGRLEEAALVSGGAVVTFTEVELDGGRQAHVQLFAQGKRVFVCPLVPGAHLQGAVFERGFLHAAVERDGGWRVETYDLQMLPLESLGWPQRDGVSGERRAR